MENTSKAKIPSPKKDKKITSLPSGAHALAALGHEVEKIVHHHFADELPIFSKS